MAAGLRVELPDMDGTGRQDASFMSGASLWYAECKFISADAGRKITRRDFYSLAAHVEQDLRVLNGSHVFAVVVTLRSRLEADQHLHGELKRAVAVFCRDPDKRIQHQKFQVYADDLGGVTGSDIFHGGWPNMRLNSRLCRM